MDMDNSTRPSLELQLADVIEGILTDRVATKDAIVALEAIYQTLEQYVRYAIHAIVNNCSRTKIGQPKKSAVEMSHISSLIVQPELCG
jgi:hypothetical protein